MLERQAPHDPPSRADVWRKVIEHFVVGSPWLPCDRPRDRVLQVEVSDRKRVRIAKCIPCSDRQRPWTKARDVVGDFTELVHRRDRLKVTPSGEISKTSDGVCPAPFDADAMKIRNAQRTDS